jgi:hypothetical protein
VVILVCVLLLVYTFFGKLASNSRDAIEHVRVIRSGNENRRWRAAYELASLIQNEPSLAHDDKLQDELSTLLSDELKKPADKSEPKTPQYLALALGRFDRLTGIDQEPPSGSVAALLSALGSKASSDVRAAAAQSLALQAAKPGSGLQPQQIAPALIEASQSKDPVVREYSAYALGYFDTPEGRIALAVRLTDESPNVRYNAAVSLARLDDPRALTLLREMLSNGELAATFSQDLKTQPGPTRAHIEAIQIEALSALADALVRKHTRLVRQLVPDITNLAKTAPPNIQVEATDLLKKLQHLAGNESDPEYTNATKSDAK